jgi:hypothetical protein
MRVWDIYVTLEARVKNMLTSLRAVGELQNSAIRERHWQQLMKSTKVMIQHNIMVSFSCHIFFFNIIPFFVLYFPWLWVSYSSFSPVLSFPPTLTSFMNFQLYISLHSQHGSLHSVIRQGMCKVKSGKWTYTTIMLVFQNFVLSVHTSLGDPWFLLEKFHV